MQIVWMAVIYTHKCRQAATESFFVYIIDLLGTVCVFSIKNTCKSIHALQYRPTDEIYINTYIHHVLDGINIYYIHCTHSTQHRRTYITTYNAANFIIIAIFLYLHTSSPWMNGRERMDGAQLYRHGSMNRRSRNITYKSRGQRMNSSGHF